MTHWSDAYLGTPYATADCGQLAAQIGVELFGAKLPAHPHPTGPTAHAEALREVVQQHLVPATEPADGQPVVMRRGHFWHVGVVCKLGRGWWVLHALRHPGRAVRTPLARVAELGLQIEGHYRWPS
jgi:hypothetical protein